MVNIAVFKPKLFTDYISDIETTQYVSTECRRRPILKELSAGRIKTILPESSEKGVKTITNS